MQEVDAKLVQRCAREGTLLLDSIEAVGTYISPYFLCTELMMMVFQHRKQAI